MMVEIITPKQQQILVALSRYKFLTTSHMIRLGIDKYPQNLNAQLVKLKERKKKLIRHINFGMGREYFYYLTPRGKQVLIDHLSIPEEEIKAPIGRSSFFSTDYRHRKGCIDCLIELELSAKQEGFTIEFCDLYYEKIGNNRRDKNLQSKARIDLTNRHIEADAIFMTSRDDKQYLYVFEYERKRDSKVIYKKCRDYLEALTIGEPSLKYGFEKGARILLVFETFSIMEAVIIRINEDVDFTNFMNYFLFKQRDEVVDDFLEGWHTIEKKKEKGY